MVKAVDAPFPLDHGIHWTPVNVLDILRAKASALASRRVDARAMSNGLVTTTTPTVATPVDPLNYVENGRTYHGFRKGIYMYPCDEPEQDRMDIFHTVFRVARSDKLHEAPIDKTSADLRILDLGTGTGIWAIDVADLYPNAEVVGVDLANIQPAEIPRNLRFRVPRDFEAPTWSLGEDSWDLIHIRQACGSVSNWPELYQKVFQHLKPGHGHIEHVELDFEPRCDDGSLPESPIVAWYSHLKDATRRAGKPIEYQQGTRKMLQNAGFTDIQEKVIRAPFNAWPRDPHQREIGRWYGVGLSDGIESMSLAPFFRSYGWPAPTIKRYAEDVQQCVMTRKFHAFNNIHVWTARRPG